MATCCGRWATRCIRACIHVPTSFATWCRPLNPCLPCAWVSPLLLLHSLPLCRSCPALLLHVQHSVGTTWAEPDDEDVPAPAPTLRAMPLRPRAVPSVILAGAAWVGWCSSATKCSAQLCDRLPPWLQLMYLPRPCACPHPPRLQVARTAPRWFQSRGGRWTHLSCQTRQPCPCRCTAAVALDCRSVSFLRCPDEGTAAHSCVSRALTPCARRACPSSALPSAPCSWPTSTLMGTPTS